MNAAKNRILLVEDDADHVELIRAAFHKDNAAELIVTETVGEARRLLKAGAADFVVADLRLPDGSGLDLLALDGVSPRVPLVVLTAFGDEQIAVQALKNGAIDYVVKSVATLSDMPHIVERAAREWDHVVGRQKAEEDLKRAHAELERRVEERTAELMVANEQLRREIEEREQAEEALRRSERLASLGTLAAGIAHELNNPLGAIQLAAHSAMNYASESNAAPQLNEALELIIDQTIRSNEIVKGVLQFTKSQSEEREPFGLPEVVRRARDLTRHYADSKQIPFQLEFPADLPLVMINPTEIEQVFVNLFQNAVEASDTKQPVTIVAGSANGNVFASVQDQGRGLADEQLRHIFDPFYTTRANDGGTGLGLSVAHGIVTKHGGTIDVVSSPGEGATFTVSLPIPQLFDSTTG